MAATRAGNIRIKRAYEPPAKTDGARILVDRLWPRGVTKAALAIERWIKEIGPSDALRRWFGHDPERWDEFRRRYQAELMKQTELLAELRGLARQRALTLVYGARDDAHNNAVVLREALLKAPGLKAPGLKAPGLKAPEPKAPGAARKAQKKAPAARPAAGASKRTSRRA
jgi:uncharacterized protein YeaO (DUF488 family)